MIKKVDGIEILRKVKTDSKLKSIPVVVLTSLKEERDMVDAYNLGVNSYITKPVDFDKFVETIKQIKYYWLLINEHLPIKAKSL